ncbi:anti-sigma factor [Virgibacillus ihumii]|uniref:anti-sigma factor n=1 Tax=Virgibacillus ihumii TaxID=2686091 RepID=UPI00157C0DD1|nr:anti-sigma factor [Virgibacillus ihumii]
MTSKHCDLLIDYFNKQLTPEQEKEYEEHLAECADCQEELTELQQLTNELPYSSEPIEPPDGMKQRVLSNVLKEEETPANTEENVTPLPTKYDTPKHGRNKWLKPAMAALLTISLVGNGAAAIYISTQSNEQEPNPDNTINLENVQAMMALQASEGFNGQATAMMVNQNDGLNLILQANDLPQLEGKETYQVWVLDDGKPYRAGNFVPDNDGSGSVFHAIDYKGEHNWDTIAVTKEPNANSQKPHGEILLSSPL